jgi:hypothetical protein
MMKKHWKKAAIGVLVLSGIALLVASLSRGDSNKPITLPDGSILYFRDVTYGTNHVFRSPLAKVTQFLPDKVEARLAQKFPDFIQIDKTATSKIAALTRMGLATN